MLEPGFKGEAQVQEEGKTRERAQDLAPEGFIGFQIQVHHLLAVRLRNISTSKKFSFLKWRNCVLQTH